MGSKFDLLCDAANCAMFPTTQAFSLSRSFKHRQETSCSDHKVMIASAHIDVVPLGAGQRVGRSCILATFAGTTVMLDCGIDSTAAETDMFPSVEMLASRRPCCVLLSHAHIDHVGALPRLCEALGPDCDILATPATISVTELSLTDAAKAPSSPLIATSVADAVARISPVAPRHATLTGGGKVRATPIPVGHVLGACAWLVEFAAGGHSGVGESALVAPALPLQAAAAAAWCSPPDAAHLSTAVRSAALPAAVPASARWPGTAASLLYTGDVGALGEVALPSPRALHHALAPDVLVCESTYVGTRREARGAVLARLWAATERALRLGSGVLVGCFALGRAQEVAAVLCSRLAADPELGARVEVRLGSASLAALPPGAGAASEPPEQATASLPAGTRAVVACAPASQHPRLRLLRAAHQSPALPPTLPARSLTDRASELYLRHPAEAPGFARAVAAYRRLPRRSGHSATVLVTAPLGLQGGAAASALRGLASDPHALVALTGSCPPGSPGRALQDGARALPGPGPAGTAVRCSVETFSLSAHADGDDLVALAGQLAPRAGVVLVHGQAARLKPHRTTAADAEAAALASSKHVLQTRLRLPVYDPPDGVEVTVALPLEASTRASGAANCAPLGGNPVLSALRAAQR